MVANTTTNTTVNLCGITMDNPVMAASGTFGYGLEFAEVYDINILGSFSCKGTTAEPRFGNPTPRIADCTEGMLNSVGLQNPGVDAVIAEELPKLADVFHKPLMANVCGGSPEEYATVASKLNDCAQIGWMEVNISCPNVKSGGMAFGTDPEAAASVISAVRKVTDKPVIAKLSPNVTDIVAIAKSCQAAGADGITAINTLLGMRIDLKTGKPVLANVMGGFSGQRHGRLFRASRIPGRTPCRLPDQPRGRHPGHRMRRHQHRRTGFGNDDGRGHSGSGRIRKSDRPIRLQKDHRGFTGNDATIWNPQLARAEQ